MPILQIRFSTKSFGRDAAGVAARAITNISNTISIADISDIIAGAPRDLYDSSGLWWV